MRFAILMLVAAASCTSAVREDGADTSRVPDARSAFADTVSSWLLDTTLHELRAHLFVKVQNPNRDDESPLADSVVAHASQPGPHTMDGKLYAELGALQDLLGRHLTVRTDTARGHVFVGEPAVLLIGHMHDRNIYVPVKLFARQFGAYTDIGCTLANCAHIWPRSVIELMIKGGNTGGAGILEGHAEGIVQGVDVTRLPSG